MKGEVMRSEFEKKLKCKELLSDLTFCEETKSYSGDILPTNLATINGAYWAWEKRQTEVDELQKRVDELELTLKGAVTYVDLQIEATEQGREAAVGTQAKNWWSSKLLMLRPVRRVLEQALKRW